MREGAWGWGSGQIPGPQQSEHAWSCILSASMLGLSKPQTGFASVTGQSARRLQLALEKVRRGGGGGVVLTCSLGRYKLSKKKRRLTPQARCRQTGPCCSLLDFSP